MQFNLKIKYAKNKGIQFRFNINKIQHIKQKKWIELIKKKTSFNDKIFCIGFAKTGTTSLETALNKFGYKFGNLFVGEMLIEDWYKKRYDRIINFCNTAEAFQDTPFGLPGLFKILDEEFENSKFILTVRDNEHQWYNSLVNYHTKMFSDNSHIPNEKKLAEATYIYEGYILETKRMIFNYPKIPLYDPKYYKTVYLQHNADVKKYFKNRNADLLVLNVADKNSFQKLANFLNIKVDKNEKFPWANKTSEY